MQAEPRILGDAGRRAIHCGGDRVASGGGGHWKRRCLNRQRSGREEGRESLQPGIVGAESLYTRRFFRGAEAVSFLRSAQAGADAAHLSGAGFRSQVGDGGGANGNQRLRWIPKKRRETTLHPPDVPRQLSFLSILQYHTPVVF